MSTLSTHILDISTGTPAEGVTVSLSREGETLANLVTNAQGRIATFSAEPLPAGRYCLTAETGAWFARAGRESVFTRRRLILLSARRQRTISICRFSSPRAGGRPTAAAKRGCPLPGGAALARPGSLRSGQRQPVGPVRRSRHRACTGGSGDHPSCFIPTQG
ncbi:transthyretin [Klebsiella pneumoniae]|nr:transthyretin [Klebsiella pneumoniae]